LVPLILGAILVLAGVLLMVIPGPGLLLFFFGLGVIGTESLLVARFMDWSEVRARRLIGRFRGNREG
jgi:hypothetical protein